MDLEIISFNEGTNDGRHIHLYMDSTTNLWVAYGLSAYGLRLLGKAKGFGTVRGYSVTMQLPCTVANKDALAELLTNDCKTIEEEYICHVIEEKIDRQSYMRWVAKLRTSLISDEQIVVTTPVSSQVPRDRFIPDGMSGFARNFKRIQDLIISSICLIVFSPLFLITWLMIKLDDGGPAIFKQERIGRFGCPFYIYKFRSMRLDAEKMGPQLSSSGGKNDPRLTKVGAFIRAHHLDELPQLWNVFCGDMAFIGPRPERKFYIDQIMEHDMRYSYLYQIRPGVTSFATLYNGYTDTMEKMLRRLEYDLYYLGHRSWWMDVKILFNTFCAIVFGKKF